MKLVYIAGPYRGLTPEETKLNIAAARHLGKLVARLGYMPVIPHCNTAGFELIAPDLPDEFWLDGTLELMGRCDCVVLVDGWQASKGTMKEITKAVELGMDIYDSTDSLVKGVML